MGERLLSVLVIIVIFDDCREVVAAGDRHNRLDIGADHATVILAGREERLETVLFDHGAPVYRHSDDAWNCFLLLNADIRIEHTISSPDRILPLVLQV